MINIFSILDALHYLYLLTWIVVVLALNESETNYLEEYERKKYMIKYVDCCRLGRVVMCQCNV